MKDMLNHELKLGNFVAFYPPRRTYLRKGKIIKLGYKFVYIEYDKLGGRSSEKITCKILPEKIIQEVKQ